MSHKNYGLSAKNTLILRAICLIMSLLTFTGLFAQDELKNRPELGLPLSDRKLVIAHNMTDIIRFKNHDLEDSCDPEYYPPEGNITEPLGGMVQVSVIADRYYKDSTLEQTVEFEIRTAMKCGIDGFQFYYPLRKRGPDDEIIKAYFRVAKKKNLDFRFTLCPSHPGGLTEELKIEEYARRMNKIFDEVGHDNPHWLRTPDGRLILYLWYGEQIVDIPHDLNGYSPKYYVARAYQRLGEAVGENFACVYSFNYDISDQELADVLDYFPAAWMWTVPYTGESYIGRKIADACKEKGRTFTGSTFASFYTSKLLPPGTWDMFHYAKDAVDAGINNVERRGIITGLSYNYRKLLEFAIEEDVPIINIITWNDYPEGHHLAPEVNHNYGFSVLLNYYISIWKNEPSPYADRDVAITFFKKYNHNIKPDPFYIPIVNLAYALPEEYEDSVEVVTILTEPAQVSINGTTKDVKSGIVSTRFDQKPGKVHVTVKHNDVTTVDFVAPEWITDKPYRTDRLIYSFSSEFSRYHYSIFGNLPPVYSREYDLEKNEIKLDLSFLEKK
ncbi:MAG: hypothetical protein JW894_15160 [Bacteroidales bacterium]|nr:hypothetical protein [Bacteroidales bacterium]